MESSLGQNNDKCLLMNWSQLQNLKCLKLNLECSNLGNNEFII